MSEFVPEGWKGSKVGDSCFVTKLAGYEYTSYFDYSIGGEIIAVRVLNLKRGKLDLSQVQTIPRATSDALPRSKLAKNDLVISYVGTVGEVAFIDEDDRYHLAPNVAKITPDENEIDGKFLAHVFTSDDTQKSIKLLGSVSSQPSLSMGNLRKVFVPLPPLSEQKKIAAILTSVDEVIEKTQAQINKLKDLKTGMMQELLTRGVGVDGKPHTEFKDSPVGRIPKGWEVVKLSEIIGSMDGGVSVNGENRLKTHKEIGVLKVSSVFKGAFIPHEHKVVIEEDLNRVKINPLKDRILFSRANTPSLVGESGYVERNYDDLYLPDKIWMIDVKDRLKVNVRWLSYILSSGKVRKLICDAATGTSSSMKNISKPNLLSIQVGMPMLEEQKAIADILNLISNKLTLSLTKLDHVKQLKKALMQDLLTGKVRVKVDTE
jgi:type I restriction enzyme S subunit